MTVLCSSMLPNMCHSFVPNMVEDKIVIAEAVAGESYFYLKCNIKWAQV